MTDNIHAHEHPESDRVRPGGFTLWFTGLSGSGKSTIAHVIGPELDKRGLVVEYLDGDRVRQHLSKGLGFSKEDRDTNIERIGWVASRLTRQGGAVIAAAISPYRETRAKAREMVEEFGTFVEVFVATSLDECIAARHQRPLRQGARRRDQGLHRRRRPVRGARERRDRRRDRRQDARGVGAGRHRQARGARPGPGHGGCMSAVATDPLIKPHGGVLVDRTGEAPADLD